MVIRKTTKNILAGSLLELSEHRPLSKITVREITENCSMTREAFYYHFKDKYDLMFWIYKTQAGDPIKEGIVKRPLVEVWGGALKELERYSFFYKDAFEDRLFRKMILEEFKEDIEYCLTEKGARDMLEDPDVRFAIDFYTRGLYQTTITWLEETDPEDVATIAGRMCAIMPQILLKYYDF